MNTSWLCKTCGGRWHPAESIGLCQDCGGTGADQMCYHKPGICPKGSEHRHIGPPPRLEQWLGFNGVAILRTRCQAERRIVHKDARAFIVRPPPQILVPLPREYATFHPVDETVPPVLEETEVREFRRSVRTCQWCAHALYLEKA